MPFFPIGAGYTTRFTLVLLVALTASGSQRKERVATYTCGDQHIKVDHTLPKGVDRKAVYLCGGDKIIWDAQPNVQFEIDFDESPWGPNNAKFGNKNGLNPYTPKFPNSPTPAPKDPTVFKYTITIVDNNGHSYPPFDPHVVGGGGLAY